MKRLLVLISLMLSVVSTGSAQIREVVMDPTGRHIIVVEVGRDKYVTVSDYGEIIDTDIPGRVQYYNSIFDEENGKIKSIGDVRFDYHTFSIYDEEVGKIRRVGNISFEYYTITIYDELKGKLKRVGNQSLEYYESFGSRNIGKEGKLKNIARVVTFDFYGQNDIRRLGRQYLGLLSSVNRNRYDYVFRNSSGNYPGNYPGGNRPGYNPDYETNNRPTPPPTNRPGNRPSPPPSNRPNGNNGGYQPRYGNQTDNARYASSSRLNYYMIGERSIYIDRYDMHISIVDDLRYFLRR